MEHSYSDTNHNARLKIFINDDEIEVERHAKHVELTTSGCCDKIRVRQTICFTCEQWEQLVCLFERMECEHQPCRCREARVFDQDDIIEDIDVEVEVEVEQPERERRPQPKRGKR